MKKRIIAGLLSVAITLAALPSQAFAAAEMKIKAGTAEAECKPGTEITVPVTAEVNPGYGSGTIDLRWDETALTLKDVEYTEAAPKNTTALITTQGFYRLSFGDYLAMENFTETGTFFTLTFEVAETATAGDYSITMERARIYDADLDDVAVTLLPGNVSLIGDAAEDSFVLTAGTAEAVAGTADEIRVPVAAEQNPGFSAGTVDVIWDAGALTLTAVEYTDLAPNNGSAKITNDGQYRISFGNYLAQEDAAGTGDMFTLVFTANEGTAAGKYPIILSDAKVMNTALKPLSVTVRAGSVILTDPAVTETTTTTTESTTSTTSSSKKTVKTTTTTSATTTEPTTTSTTTESETTITSATESETTTAETTTTSATESETTTAETTTTSTTESETTTAETTTTSTTESETTTAETTTTSATETTTSKPDDWFASLDDLSEMAKKDYADKHADADDSALQTETEITADGNVQVTIQDQNNEVLDVYTIDPKTGTGTNSENETVNLPQTGVNSTETAATVGSAIAMIFAGAWMMLRASAAKRKEESAS